MKRSAMFVSMAVVAAVAAGTYLPTLWGDFVYDDMQVLIGDYIHQPAHFWEVLTFRVMGRDVIDFNRPMMLLSLIVDSMIWGREPFGYHLTNVLLHAACSVMLLVVLLQIFRRLSQYQAGQTRPMLGALAGALLFAVHPINSEAVSPVTFREDLLVPFFALLMFLLIDGFPAKRKPASVLLGAACALLMLASVASKETGAIVPVFVALYWLVVRRRSQWRPWAGLVTAGCILVGLFIAARFTFGPQDSEVFYPVRRLGGSFTETLKIQPRIWTLQLMLIFRPDVLCADQQLPYAIEPVGLGLALGTLGVLAVSLVALAFRNPAAGLGSALYCLAIAPASNLLPMYRPIADRYLYFPMAGVAMVVGAVVWRLKMPRDRRALVAMAAGGVGILAMLATFTVRRTFVWQNSISLWSDTVARNRDSFTGHTNLGFALFDAARADPAP
ncbi:MAG: hypothetical protein ACYTF6_06210 [Planctomycetota bacterium]|jgi:hypothetical protein